MINEGFKVVKRYNNGRYWSPHCLIRKCAVVEYIPGQWAFPQHNCGPLSVYETLNQALENNLPVIGGQRWIHSTAYSIWECLYIQSREKFFYEVKTPIIQLPPEQCDYTKGIRPATQILLVKKVWEAQPI